MTVGEIVSSIISLDRLSALGWGEDEQKEDVLPLGICAEEIADGGNDNAAHPSEEHSDKERHCQPLLRNTVAQPGTSELVC